METRQVAELLVDAYRALPGNEVGGSLHVVLDDFNFEDSSVEFCRDYATEQGDAPGRALAEVLLALSLEDRGYACVPTLCVTCQHSTALHFLDMGNGAGASQNGPCELPECGCRECVRLAVA